MTAAVRLNDEGPPATVAPAVSGGRQRRGPLYSKQVQRFLERLYRGAKPKGQLELIPRDPAEPPDGEVWAGPRDIRGRGRRIVLGKLPKTGDLEVFWSKGWMDCPYGRHPKDQPRKLVVVTEVVQGVRVTRAGWYCCWEAVQKRPVELPALGHFMDGGQR